MPYSATFLDILGLTSTSSRDAFIARLDDLIPDSLLGGLINSETRDTLIDNFESTLDLEVGKSKINLVFTSKTSYHEVKCAKTGTQACQILELHKVSSVDALVSDARKLLILYIAITGDMKFPFLLEDVSAPPFHRDDFNVLFLWGVVDDKKKELIRSTYSPSVDEPTANGNEYNPHTSATLDPDGFYSKVEEFGILREALSETRIKWRFLLLYRILENGYIRNLLESIQSNIFFNPKDTLIKATDSVQNEFLQLTALIDKNGLGEHFDAIRKAVYKGKSGNKFLEALQNKLESDPRAKKQKPAHQGAFIVYQIRCSIVHAGEMSIFFDKYPDATIGLQSLYEHFDTAIFKYLGFSFKP
ncbi:hypothetical protein [Burkholderia territorii]|uniref:hypothetical protein n=1 Tax=Burkholderia territorii TaxID=1503055 RepID=UPI000A4A9808|nr:hypothetical protein [Burkholderia territorii]